MKFPSVSNVPSEIPTASMADIAFLLIVFFMVTTTFAATKGLDFTLPTNEDDEKIEAAEEEEAVYINVKADGVYVDCQPMELSGILPYLKPKLDNWKDKPVILHTELDAKYSQMVQAYDELAKAKDVLGYDIPNISIPTSAEIENYVAIFGYNPFAESCK